MSANASTPPASCLPAGENGDDESRLSKGAAAGISVALIIAAFALLFSALLFWRRQSQSEYETNARNRGLPDRNTASTAPSLFLPPAASELQQRRPMSLVPEKVATRSRSLARDEATVVPQLFREFIALLEGELSDGARRAKLEECIRQSCGITNHSIICDSIQAVADKFADYVRDHFAEEMARMTTSAQKAPWRAQLPSRSLHGADEYAGFLSGFVQQKLRRFYDPYGRTVQNIARQAAQEDFCKADIPQEFIPGLAKLALYDFIMFCDDSNSMKLENRIQALRDTLGRVATFATILSPNGISIRTLNHSPDIPESWDDLKTVKDVQNRMDSVSCSRGTRLGTSLWSKVLEPMILNKAKSDSLKKPVIVVIITDGEPTNEPLNTLSDSIWYCNDQMERLGYNSASVIFLISRVGTSEEARQFVMGLGNDRRIGSMVYVSPSDLALKKAAFKRSGDDNEYTLLLIKLFLSALHARTEAD